ncbi:MAG: FtsX-like permease family protein, partial [Enterococcus aquimarinus]
SGKLVLLVTHSERVAARSSRIVTIADGSIISDQEYPENQVYHSKEHLSRFSLTSRPKNRNLSFFAAMKLAFLNMKEKFSRSVLIALGGSIGIMSIILMLSLGSGVNAYLTNLMQEQVNPVVSEVRMPEPEEQETSNSSTSEITEDPTGMPMDPAQNSPVMRNDNVPFEQADLEILEDIDGVASLEKGYSTFSLGNNSIMYNDRYRSFMNFITMSSMITTANLSEGEFPQEGEILITQGIANSIGEDSIGKEVTVTLMMDGVITKTEMVISGIFASSDAVGPTAVFDSIYMNYADVEAIAQANDIELQPNVVYLVAEDAQANTRVKEEIKTLGYQGSAVESIAKLFTDMIDIFTYILAGVAGLSLFVSAIMILTVLYISVVERTQEIGVIKATGGRKKDIRRIFVSESFLIGVFSGSFGVGFAYILSIIGNRVVEQQFGTTIFLVEYQFIVMGMVISILLSVIAGLLPSVRASRLDPVEALRHE